MINLCPGQDHRKAKPESLICAHCGYVAEIFFDEIQAQCAQCKHSICKERLPSCVDWCKAARECVGEEKYKQIRGSSLKINSDGFR
ncbi:MAG: phosphohydrolase [Candidatus Omnitrophota bacterium]